VHAASDWAVVTKLKADPDPRLHRIEVSTLDGVVTLHGVVDSVGARSVAVMIADDISGVVRVIQDLDIGEVDADDEPDEPDELER
jgi:osmotically-inducible protein OsmY